MALDKAPDDDFDDKPAKAKPSAMDDRELVAILRAEEIDASSYYTSELAKDQANLLFVLTFLSKLGYATNFWGW